MKVSQWSPRKVVIVGAGAVGSTFAYALTQSGVADEIVLIDNNNELATGQVLDLSHGLAFFPQLDLYVGSPADYHDASIIVITAGAKQQPGDSRISLLTKNAALMKDVAQDITAQNSHAIIIVVSNPVDILTYILLKELGWPSGRVIGSGTVLDSARFRYLLSKCCRIDVHNIHGYILGEHGDSEFAAWSLTHLAGKPVNEHCTKCNEVDGCQAMHQRIEDEVRNSAYHIIDYKGATNFAIGMALVRIVTAILRNQRSVLTVSTLLQGEYGLKDVCLSLPCVVSQEGVEQIIEANLAANEQLKLFHSASVLKKSYSELYSTP
jgi:L-lactate dehydrogenase